MTVGDYPEYLAVGYLVNQNIIKDHTKIEKVEVVDITFRAFFTAT